MTLPELIVSELRKRGEKRIKSVFLNETDGTLSVFLKEQSPTGLPMGKKSFNYTLDGKITIPSLVDDILLLAGETLERPDDFALTHLSEEEYEGERADTL